ncbi:DeoR/GlpR family DNA-binding transcription regulator [Microbacterium sp. NPDC058345]|uniref:DeoR/GlpR family DNA-binding transcription regulator n=1 Tax=Microbacterium sp. NPDC058345 TaxID=3346455 RepID=UPI003668C270
MRYTDAPERRAQLERQISAEGYLASAVAAARLGVSEMTVRRDLRLLEEQGLVRRVAGGAAPASGGVPFENRDAVGTAQKRAIAALAAEEAAAASIIALDAGTTVAATVPLLPEATIVTHSQPVIDELARAACPRLIAVGGHYQPDTRSFAGPLTEQMLRGVRCDLALLSATAADRDGLWGANVLDAAIKRVLAAQSARVVLLADAGKLATSTSAPVRIAGLDAIDVLITDDRADSAALAPFRAAGIEVRIAR